MNEENSNETDRYNIGVTPGKEKAIAEAESRAISVVDRIEFGNVRTVIVGIYTREEATALSEYSGIAYVERDEEYEHHNS